MLIKSKLKDYLESNSSEELVSIISQYSPFQLKSKITFSIRSLLLLCDQQEVCDT